jgi:hypothetical protein
MHDSEVEVQTIKGTREKKAAVGGEMDIEKLMEFNFVKEGDEPKGQFIKAMKSNANQLTNSNLIKSPLTPDKERQLKEIIENKIQLDKIKPFQGESFLTWECMQKLLNFYINDEDMTKKWIGDEVVSTYCKEYLAQQDETRCQEENGRKHSWFINSFFSTFV